MYALYVGDVTRPAAVDVQYLCLTCMSYMCMPYMSALYVHALYVGDVTRPAAVDVQ